MFLILLTNHTIKILCNFKHLTYPRINNSAGQIQKNVADISVPIRLEEI